MFSKRTESYQNELDRSAQRQTLGTTSYDGKVFCILHRMHEILTITLFQSDMLNSLSRTKPTVHDADLNKLQKFSNDFGQDG